MKIIDLFCGCGGMSLGFQNSGFDIVASFDNWQPAVEIYKKNFQHPIYNMDLYSDEALQHIQNLKAPCLPCGREGKRDSL